MRLIMFVQALGSREGSLPPQASVSSLIVSSPAGDSTSEISSISMVLHLEL